MGNSDKKPGISMTITLHENKVVVNGIPGNEDIALRILYEGTRQVVKYFIALAANKPKETRVEEPEKRSFLGPRSLN